MNFTREELMHMSSAELAQAHQSRQEHHAQGVDDMNGHSASRVSVVQGHDDHPAHEADHGAHNEHVGPHMMNSGSAIMQRLASNPELQRKYERKEVHRFVYQGKEYFRKKRVPLSQEVRDKLEEAYKSGRVTRGRAARPAKVRLAEELELTLQQVNKWFDNRRTKEYRQDSKMLAYIDHADGSQKKRQHPGDGEGEGDQQARKLPRQEPMDQHGMGVDESMGGDQHPHQEGMNQGQVEGQQQDQTQIPDSQLAPNQDQQELDEAQQQQQQQQHQDEEVPQEQQQAEEVQPQRVLDGQEQGQEQAQEQPQQDQDQAQGQPQHAPNEALEEEAQDADQQQQQPDEEAQAQREIDGRPDQGQEQTQQPREQHELDETAQAQAQAQGNDEDNASEYEGSQAGFGSRSRKETEGFSNKLEENNLSEGNAKEIARAFRTIKYYLAGQTEFYQAVGADMEMHDQDVHGDRAYAARRARRRTKIPPTLANVLESLLTKDSILFPCVRAVQIAASHGAIRALKTMVVKSEQNFRTLLLWYIIGKYSGDREVEVVMKSVVVGLGSSLQTLNVADALDRHFPELIESKARGTYDGGQALGATAATAAHVPSAVPAGDPSRVLFTQETYPASSHWADNFLSEAFVGQKIMHEGFDGEIVQVLPPASRSSKEPRFQVYLNHQGETVLSWESVKPYLVSNQWSSQHGTSQAGGPPL